MSNTQPVIPVILFAYSRVKHLRRVLGCLRENRVPLLYIFADGAKNERDGPAVAETRAFLRAIDWCEVHLAERAHNLGLGANVLAGVTEVAARHQAFIVWEDDLVCARGTYGWLCAALQQYAADPRVMSVTAWNHLSVTPSGIVGTPYFDGRAECWVWGAYQRSWLGMGQSAVEKMAACCASGLSPEAYGADLPVMAKIEEPRNIWAVRWLFHHIQHRGLCLRPAKSFVDHIGLGESATNAGHAIDWLNEEIRAPLSSDYMWPEVVENSQCSALWRARMRTTQSFRSKFYSGLRSVYRIFLSEALRKRFREKDSTITWDGSYKSWDDAVRVSAGYDDAEIVDRVDRATRKAASVSGLYERDGVVLVGHPPRWRALTYVVDHARRWGRRLSVVDFGGALGSVYRCHRSQIPNDIEVSWRVIEQPQFVARGREHHANEELNFFESIRELGPVGPQDVLILSGVLQYLPSPHSILGSMVDLGFGMIIVDRTPVGFLDEDCLSVQNVPARFGRTSYPCWVFGREKLLGHFHKDFLLDCEFAALDSPFDRGLFRGFIFSHRKFGAPSGVLHGSSTR